MSHNVELIERIKGLPGLVEVEIEGMSDGDLRQRPPEGGWSIKQVCGHLCDDSKVWRQRVYMMITQSDPLLPRYEQEELVAERAYQEADIASTLAEFRRVRLEIVDMLTELARDHWKRTGQHWERGRMTIKQGMETMAEHSEGHLAQIRALKRTSGEM